MRIKTVFKAVTAWLIFASANAFASAEDFLDPLSEKTNSIIEPLTMFGGTIATLAIVVIAVMFMFGKIPKFLAGCVVAGCSLLLTASLIGNFLLA